MMILSLSSADPSTFGVADLAEIDHRRGGIQVIIFICFLSIMSKRRNNQQPTEGDVYCLFDMLKVIEAIVFHNDLSPIHDDL